ncbi:hypothetical protein [Bradyrhizobium ivorense]|uniref:hypothetical protein n=1 Tax=Bradyrhizobium ivorense TaxID=2511166 RepID=UPI001FCE3445|nr:hypothetical protein [Bradyrhizobium ivorense]
MGESKLERAFIDVRFAVAKQTVVCSPRSTALAEAVSVTRAFSSDDFDDAHHPLVFVIDRVTMVDEPTDDCGINRRIASLTTREATAHDIEFLWR